MRNADQRGRELEELDTAIDRLWPILRSIAGPGVRQTFDILGDWMPHQRLEIPSGEAVFDWTVPLEWQAREAYLIAPDGRRILDVAENNLHLVNYSIGFRGRVTRAELDEHLYSLPEQPDAIPYVTSYYRPRWGFCLSETQRRSLPEGEYEVVIDAEHVEGSLTVAEAVLPGREDGEVLFSSYVCHPSLANNELSGPLVLAMLYRRLAAWPDRRLTYRFALTTETVGTLAYLSRRGEHLRQKVQAGYVVTCVGDPGCEERRFTYKRSRRQVSLADRAAIHVLDRVLAVPYQVVEFMPDNGSDERQYCSPGFDLPVGSLMRTMYGCYPQYHTSLDDRSLITREALQGSVDAYEQIARVLDANQRYRSLVPYGEPQLGRRNLYSASGNHLSPETSALLWTLNFSDGKHDLLSIAERSGHPFPRIAQAAKQALDAGLLAEDGEH